MIFFKLLEVTVLLQREGNLLMKNCALETALYVGRSDCVHQIILGETHR